MPCTSTKKANLDSALVTTLMGWVGVDSLSSSGSAIVAVAMVDVAEGPDKRCNDMEFDGYC